MKFQINFSPVSSARALALSKRESSLIINDTEFDFSFLNDGDTLLRTAIDSDWIGSDVSRVGDVINITVRLPHGSDAPQSARFPQSILVAQNGPVMLPGGANAD